MRNDSFDRQGFIKPDATVATPRADQRGSVGLDANSTKTGRLDVQRSFMASWLCSGGNPRAYRFQFRRAQIELGTNFEWPWHMLTEAGRDAGFDFL